MKHCLQVLSVILLLLLLAEADAQQTACPFSFGLVSKTNIDLNGNDVYVDSFDSRDATKSTSGRYDPAKRQPDGNVTIGGSLTNSAVNLGNANIYGVVFISPSGTVTMGPNGSIGPTFWDPATSVSQAMANGWIGTNCLLYVPDVSLPSSLSSASSLGTINNNSTLNSGDYRADSISLAANKTLSIRGIVRLYVTGSVSITGTASIVISNGMSLVLCAGGSVFVAGNGVVNNTGLATNNRFYGLPTSTAWSIAFVNQWIGVVWAPEAALDLGGGDASGGFIASNITFNSTSRIHYDESVGMKVCTSASVNGGAEGITGIGLTGSNISISFPAAALRLYTVEYADDPTISNWTGLASTNTLSCTGELMTVTDSGAVNLPQRFYRLRIHPNLLGQ